MVKFSYSKLSQQCIGGLAGSNNESGIIGHLFYSDNLFCIVELDFTAVTAVESADDGILKIGKLVGHNNKGTVDKKRYEKTSSLSISPNNSSFLNWTYITKTGYIGHNE